MSPVTHLPDNNPLPQFAGKRLPPWLRKRLPAGGDMIHTRQVLADLKLNTVCAGAHCPNLPECWTRHTATFMILGNVCSRRCRYCAVTKGTPTPVSPDEPHRLAQAAQSMRLRHVVITSVTRDDLTDEGAAHFAACVAAVRTRLTDVFVEVLTPDFHARRELIETVLSAAPTIFNHNIETVRRLTPSLRPQADYDRSLATLRIARDLLSPSRAAFTKSGLMIGLGETDDEIVQTLTDLRGVGCDIVTIGQYLAPSPQHAPIDRFYTPEEFAAFDQRARAMGFVSVASGPFVRSSYNAAEVFARAANG